MKKQIAMKLSIFVITILVSLIIINSILQYKTVEKTEETIARSTIAQIEEILITNEANLDTLTESLKDEYIIKAQMTAYIWENIAISTSSEYQELATLLNVDEIHIFNMDGVIYEGSEEKYFGYSFDSGEQMSFFQPLLEDKSLTLCQDITPNTAESKAMMYVATWTSDGSNIVQIGLEPERILEEQSQNELSYIFTNMPTTNDTTLFAIDQSTGIILGSSNTDYLTLHSTDIGIVLDDATCTGDGFYTVVNGTRSLCIFQAVDDTYIGLSIDASIIYDQVINGIIAINVYFFLTAICLYFALLKIIDMIILRNIDSLISEMQRITHGDLDTVVNINTSPEFTELSNQINIMVSSLLRSTDKISSILDRVDTKIAIYEYKKDMKRVFATSKLSELLKIKQEDLSLLLEDKLLFEARIAQIKEHAFIEDNVYSLDYESFISIETLSNDDGEYGLIVDVSGIAKERHLLKYERDYDVLTDLLNRRAFYREIESLFTKPDLLKESVIIALDMDNLKQINDTFGHDGGDAAIKHAAYLLELIPTTKKFLCRVGGDEFLAIIYGEDDRSKSMEYIDNLSASYLDASTSIGDHTISIKMSAGYLYSSDFKPNYTTLLKFADEALYIAKRSGKSRFVQYL